jgi:hypothetical protein
MLMLRDISTEPPVPAGLGNLSAGLRAIVDFFEIDEGLIAGHVQQAVR